MRLKPNSEKFRYDIGSCGPFFLIGVYLRPEENTPSPRDVLLQCLIGILPGIIIAIVDRVQMMDGVTLAPS